jgi:structural maintenance of chromosome 1
MHILLSFNRIHSVQNNCLDHSDAERKYIEFSEKADEYQSKINESKVDKNENQRFQRRQELLDSLKRLFPGVYGRLIDLCEPVHKK